MALRRMVLLVEIDYEEGADLLDVEVGLTRLFEEALSTPGITDELGNADIAGVYNVSDRSNHMEGLIPWLETQAMDYGDENTVAPLGAADEVDDGWWVLAKLWVPKSAGEEG